MGQANMENPYQPPEAPIELPTDPAGEPIPRSRWTWLRWIPLLYSGCLTVASFGFAVMSVVLLAVWVARNGYQRGIIPMQIKILPIRLPVAVGMTDLGMRTTQAWYHYQWRRAIGLTLVYFSLAVVCDYVDKVLR